MPMVRAFFAPPNSSTVFLPPAVGASSQQRERLEDSTGEIAGQVHAGALPSSLHAKRQQQRARRRTCGRAEEVPVAVYGEHGHRGVTQNVWVCVLEVVAHVGEAVGAVVRVEELARQRGGLRAMGDEGVGGAGA